MDKRNRGLDPSLNGDDPPLPSEHRRCRQHTGSTAAGNTTSTAKDGHRPTTKADGLQLQDPGEATRVTTTRRGAAEPPQKGEEQNKSLCSERLSDTPVPLGAVPSSMVSRAVYRTPNVPPGPDAPGVKPHALIALQGRERRFRSRRKATAPRRVMDGSNHGNGIWVCHSARGTRTSATLGRHGLHQRGNIRALE